MYFGNISFSLQNLPITQSQFEVFKKFYEDYNDEIKLVVNKCSLDNFCVWFTYQTENGKKGVDKSDSLDNLYNFLLAHIDKNKVVTDDNEVLVGVGVDEIIRNRAL